MIKSTVLSINSIKSHKWDTKGESDEKSLYDQLGEKCIKALLG